MPSNAELYQAAMETIAAAEAAAGGVGARADLRAVGHHRTAANTAPVAEQSSIYTATSTTTRTTRGIMGASSPSSPLPTCT